jgi:hypothetical protein
VVYDLRTRLIKWSQHLDLSTDTTKYRAYAYATPTLVDVDRCAVRAWAVRAGADQYPMNEY